MEWLNMGMDHLVRQQAWAELRQSLRLMAALGRSGQALWRLTWRWLAVTGLTAVSLLTILASLTTYFPLLAPTEKWLRLLNWLLDLSSHFLPHYTLILGIVTAVFFFRQRMVQGGITAVFFLLNLTLITPFYLNSPSPTVPAPTYQILLLNVRAKNDQYDQTLALIDEKEPDIVVLIDMLEEWRDAMLPLLKQYPYHNHYHSSDYHGIIIYSRFPFDNKAGIQPVHLTDRPAALAQISLDGQRLTLLAAHPPSPLRIGRMEQRNQQLLALADMIASQSGARLLLGDLNTSPWSPAFRQFIGRSGLHNGRDGFGLQTSWPAPLGFLGIPIDHVLASSEITIHQLERGPNVASDHYPILFTFSLAPPAHP